MDNNKNDWDEVESPRGMSGMEAGADIVAALAVAGVLAGIVYTVGF